MAEPCCTVNRYDRRHHSPACRFYQPTLRERLVAWIREAVSRG